MSETIKIEIEIPPPPEGWGEVEYRRALPGDQWLNCGAWYFSRITTDGVYPVARKLPPLWTPPPELVAVLKPGWLTRDGFDIVALHGVKPERSASDWRSQGREWELFWANPDMLPPLTIPWEQCCFKIGEPKE